MLLFTGLKVIAQIGIGTTSPHPSAILDVSSNNKGFLLPRLTQSQRNRIVNPASGLTLFCTDCCSNGESSLSFYNSNGWENIPSCTPNLTIQQIVEKSARISLNATNFVATIGTDGNIYTWGNNTISNQAVLGHGVNVASSRKPKSIINPNNIRFEQVATGEHGLAIGLSDEGYVYGAGLTSKGAGNLGDPNTFTKVVLPSDTKARLIGVSEGGVLVVGQNDKTYIWGYGDSYHLSYFASWNSVLPVERPLPTNVESKDVIAAGASHHFVSVATNNKIYFSGSSVLSNNTKGGWYENPSIFNNVLSLKVGRNIVIVEDEDGYHSITSSAGKTTIDLSAVSEPINQVLANGGGQTVFVVTDTKIYYKVNPTDMTGATVANAPAGYNIIGLAPCKVLKNWSLVLLENIATGDYEYFGLSTDAFGSGNVGLFSTNIQSLGLDLSEIPPGVKLTW